MKILSKFKDNYDFIVNKYGIDDMLIFDRRNSTPVRENELFAMTEAEYKSFKSNRCFWIGKSKFNPEFETAYDSEALHCLIFVGNEAVNIFATEDKIYTQFDLADDEIEKTRNTWHQNDMICRFKDGAKVQIVSHLSESDRVFSFSQKISRNDFFGNQTERHSDNPINDAPLVLIKAAANSIHIFINPHLQKIGLYIDADFVWQNIVQFLSDKKDRAVQTKQIPNEVKIASKGFDVKRSFRPKMKNVDKKG